MGIEIERERENLSSLFRHFEHWKNTTINKGDKSFARCFVVYARNGYTTLEMK